MKDLHDTFVIARRELLERVRSKWFVVITLLAPIGIVAMIVIPAVIGSRSSKGTKVDIVDRSGVLAQPITAALAEEGWIATTVDPKTPDAAEEDKIRTDRINGYIVIEPDALDGGTIYYRGDNASAQGVQVTLRQKISGAVINARARHVKMTDEQRAFVLRKVDVTLQHTTGEKSASSGVAASILGFALAFILYTVIVIYGIAVMRSVVQEKTSRVMELMIAAVKPRSLMSGKILGVGGAGLIQVGAWLVMGAAALYYREELLGLFGVKASGGSAFPELAPDEVIVSLLYFIMGFFFYAAMFAAAGAMVSSEQDTQQVQTPVTIVLMIGIISLNVISNDPRGSSAATMTAIPFWSPILMPMRYVLGGATLTDVAISLGILGLSTALVVRAAAKIYRTGVLMYGKRPSVRELLRWLRY